MPVVVVGIDGSRGSDAALGFALQEAQLRHAELRVVCASELPPIGCAPGSAALDLEEALERAAHEIIEDALRRVQPPSDVKVGPRVVRGQAAEVLLRVADDADDLVVGSRGKGGFRALPLGSVSHAGRASCARPGDDRSDCARSC